LAMFGSFLLPVHNSPAAPAADEIRVQKKRVVSDAPKAWFFCMEFILEVFPRQSVVGCVKKKEFELNWFVFQNSVVGVVDCR